MVMVVSEGLLVALLGAVILDLLLGDPSNKYHPVAWLGRLIGFFVPKLKDNNNCTKKERVRGIIFSNSLIIVFGIIIHVGAISAVHVSFTNYMPARITAFLMVIVAKFIGADSKKSLQTLKRDHNKTASINAGYTMATMAGALRIKLEKIGYYSIGEEYEPSSIEKCKTAISIMKLTT